MKLSRGRELITMIKLDSVEWSLYESAPIAYEEFIRNYGNLINCAFRYQRKQKTAKNV